MAVFSPPDKIQLEYEYDKRINDYDELTIKCKEILQEKLYRIIEKLTLYKAEQLGIPRRTFFDWKKKIREGKRIKLKKKITEFLA